MDNKDRFGNAIPFAPTPKDKSAPTPIVDAGPELTHKENKELKLKLDIMHVQRGDVKGMRYWGKNITKDNLERIIEFYGADYIASRLDTTFNTECQRYCLGQGDSTKDTYIKPVEKEEDLIDVLTNPFYSRRRE
jgi:hypothetical protein